MKKSFSFGHKVLALVLVFAGFLLAAANAARPEANVYKITKVETKASGTTKLPEALIVTTGNSLGRGTCIVHWNDGGSPDVYELQGYTDSYKRDADVLKKYGIKEWNAKKGSKLYTITTGSGSVSIRPGQGNDQDMTKEVEFFYDSDS